VTGLRIIYTLQYKIDKKPIIVNPIAFSKGKCITKRFRDSALGRFF
jgi:hypothetical protein